MLASLMLIVPLTNTGKQQNVAQKKQKGTFLTIVHFNEIVILGINQRSWLIS